MSFLLSIGFLAALPLVAAPLLLHLFDRRRNVVIDWGAMQFLLEAATKRTSARRMQHWLLLLLRTIAIAALIFALARPLLPGSWFGRVGRKETILILDNSMSTQRRQGDATLFDAILREAESQRRMLAPGDTLRILTTSPYPNWVTQVGLRIDAEPSDSVAADEFNIQPTESSSDLLSALLKVIQSEPDDETCPSRKIVLLADVQRNDWKTNDATGWSQFQSSLQHSKIPTELKVIEFGKHQARSGNLGVNHVRANRTIVGVNRSLTVTAQVQNYSAIPTEETAIQWFVDGEKVGIGVLNRLEADAVQDISFAHSFAAPGVYSLTCRIDSNDELATDNESTIVVKATDSVPILIVESSEGYAELQQDAYLLRAALGQLEGETVGGWKAVFEPRTISPVQLETLPLNEYHAVIVPNYNSLTDESIEQLSHFVEGGGGLWLALGPRSEVDQFNDLIFQDGDGLSPVGIERIVDESDRSDATRINPFLKPHPATLELADQARLDLGDVKIERRFRFAYQGSSQEISTLLNLTNGDAAFVENQYGRGRVLVQAMPLTYQWSGLTKSQSFVVMVQNWLSYLTESSATDYNLNPGEPITYTSTDPDLNSATLSLPDGEEISLIGEANEDRVDFRTSRTVLPGVYHLEVGPTGESIPYYVSRPASESDLTLLTPNDREFLTANGGLGRELGRDELSSASFNSPVWPALLMILIAAMSGELVLSGLISRQRFGGTAIAETTEAAYGIESSTSSFNSRTFPNSQDERKSYEVVVSR